jgi:hypothetical protein
MQKNLKLVVATQNNLDEKGHLYVLNKCPANFCSVIYQYYIDFKIF